MTIRRLMIYPGELTRAFYEELLSNQTDVAISCVLLNSQKDVDQWSSYVGKEAIVCWSDILNPNSEYLETPFHRRWYQLALDELTSDQRSYYILERHFRNLGSDIFFNSVFNRIVDLELIVWNTLSILNDTRPDRIVHYNVPHGLFWFVSRVAELVGVQVVTAAVSPLPWKEWVVHGLDEQEVLTPDTPATATGDGRITKFVNMIKGSYDAAMPQYEKERFAYFKGNFFSLKKELKSLCGTVIRQRNAFAIFTKVFLSIQKWRVIKEYNNLAEGGALPDKYIVFFLHYQPERTTLPEGGSFAQQWMALRLIAESLPSGCKLLVKEHPSTFRYYFHPGFRSPDFHRKISQLPNTKLVPLKAAPYPLIDNSLAVATITGTVGVEALIRGKSVLVFGSAQYRGQKGVYAVDSSKTVRRALKEIALTPRVMRDEELEAYFAWVDECSFPVWEGMWPGVLTPELNVTARDVMRAAIFTEIRKEKKKDSYEPESGSEVG